MLYINFIKKKKDKRVVLWKTHKTKWFVDLLEIPIMDWEKAPLERTKVAQRDHGGHPWRQSERTRP